MTNYKNYQNKSQEELIQALIDSERENTRLKREIEKWKTEVDDFYLTLLETLPVGIQILERSGRLIFANSVLKTQFKAQATQAVPDAIRKRISDFCPSNKAIRVGETYKTEIVSVESKLTFEVIHTGFRYHGEPALLQVFVDISKRREAEEMLRDVNEKLQLLFNNVDDALMHFNNNDELIYANPAAPAMYGYTSVADMMGLKGIVLSADPTDIDRVKTIIAQDGQIYDKTFQARRKDGSLFWASMNAKYILDEAGNVQGIQAFVRDTTERSKIEMELLKAKERAEKNEQRLAEAQELAQIGSWEWYKDTNKAEWSIELFKILGLDPSQPAPDIDGFRTVFKPESWDKYTAIVEKCFETHKPINVIVELIRPNGESFFAKINGRLILDATGEVKGVQGTLQDTDKRMRMELELIEAKERAEKNEQKLNEAQYIAHSGSFEWVIETDEVKWSPAFYQLVGLDPSLPAPNYAETANYHTPESFERLKKAVEKCLEDHLPYAVEIEMIRTDGSLTHMVSYGQVMRDPDGNVIGLHGTVQEVNEQKRLEKRLIKAKEDAEENARKLNEAEKLAHLGSWHWNMLVDSATWSEALYQIAGLDPAIPLPKYAELYKIVTQESVDLLAEAVPKCLKTEQPFEAEITMIKPDGTQIITLWRARVWKGDDGEVIGLHGTVQDIDAQKKLENKLIKAKEDAEEIARKLNEAEKLAHLGSWQWNRISDTATWSETLYKIVEMDPSLPPPSYVELPNILSPESAEILVTAVPKCLESEKPFELEMTMIKPDGSQILTLWRSNVLKNGKNEIIGLYGTVQDISEQKKLENNLIKAKENAEENAQKLSEAEKLALLGSWQWNKDDDVATWSESFYKIMEMDPELPAPSYSELPQYLTRESMDNLDKAATVCLETGKPFEMELTMIKPNGKRTLIFWRSNILKDQSGQVIGLHGTVQDINSYKKLEHELIAAKEKAEESNRLKTAFLMNMSHEIRTPMNGILGFTNLLSEPDLEDEERSQFIDIINQSGKRLMQTINDILEISKIEIGDLVLHFNETDLTELMKYQYDFFKLQTDEENLQFELSGQVTGLAAKVTTDRHKLDGILMNLIRNAVKYTDEGKIEFGNYVDEGRLYFFVRDTGRGIPEEKKEIIFERFVQTDNGLTRSYEGSGIGLSIVKAYVEAFGGEIEVDSVVGEGTTFRFWIPYSPV